MGQNSTNLMKKHCKKEAKESEPRARPFGSSVGTPQLREESLKSTLFLKLRARVGIVTAH